MNLARFFLAVAAFVLCAGTAQAQRAARILIGYPPGSPMDVVARMYAEKLADVIGRPFVLETRAGSSGQIAAMALKAAAPDGNTLMLAPDSILTLYPHTAKTLPYDTLADFVPVAHVGSFDYGLVVGAGVPAIDLKEWIRWASADRKNAAYGSPGAGASAHFLGLMLAQASGVPLVHVAYRGVVPAIADLLGGQIPAVMLPFAQMLPLAKMGKVRILAHSGGRRSSAAPEVPTFVELGYPALEVSGWYCIIAPAGIRPEVVAQYNEIIVQAGRTSAVRDRMRTLNLEIRELAPAEIAAMLKVQFDRWGPIVKASGFSADSQ